MISLLPHVHFHIVTFTAKPLDARAVTLALLTALIWGGNTVAIKMSLLDVPPFRLIWMRFLVGGLSILVWAGVSRAPMRVPREERSLVVILGLLFSIQIGMFLWGTNLTTAGHAVVLGNIYPVHVMLLAHVFVPGDRMTARKLIALLLGYLGVVLVFAPQLFGHSGSLLGDIAVSAASALIAVRTIALNRAVQRIEPVVLLLAQAIMGTVMFALVDLFVDRQIPTHLTARLLLTLAYQGVLISGFNFSVNLWLLKHYRPSAISMFYLSTPLFGVFSSWLILGEPLTAYLLAGATLVAIGIGLASLPTRRVRHAA
ncbi:MAG TPA: DMT family transporter [Methylomirabilota bacterium]|nr:DMT family transporter [Methylomirabilota bacterium]